MTLFASDLFASDLFAQGLFEGFGAGGMRHAGSNKKRRPVLVERDGQDIEVGSYGEALDMLEEQQKAQRPVITKRERNLVRLEPR